ncbi:MAG: cytochrome c peroxidase [Chitinophagales bacterium]
MKKFYFLGFVFVLFVSSCKDDLHTNHQNLDDDLVQSLITASNGKGIDYYILPESDNFSAIPQDDNNPISAAKVELGQNLYHETAIALHPKNTIGLQTYSCSSCHFASAGFQACRVQGIGDGGSGFGTNGEHRINDPAYNLPDIDTQPIRSPSTLNSAYQRITLWNGQFGANSLNVGTEYAWTQGTPKEKNNLGFDGLETQAIAGLGVHRMDIDTSFVFHTAYKWMFDKAFPNIPEEQRYTLRNAGLAIAAYERTLLANRAPFQDWLRGNDLAMNMQEKEGAILFFTKAGCANCHNGPALNSMGFYAYGMNDLGGESTYNINENQPEHLGRGGFTQNAYDMYKFKVPQLYNLKDSPFFGHGSSFRAVRDVVAYKNAGVPENANVPQSQLAADFKPLGLTETEIDAITAFLLHSLHDPQLHRYEPELLPSGLCFPNNDPASKEDLGCQ